jgi:hypothetical protein
MPKVAIFFPYEKDKLKELAEIVKNKNAKELISFIKNMHSKKSYYSKGML